MICNDLNRLYLENSKLCLDLRKHCQVTLLMSLLQFEVSGDASVYSVERSVNALFCMFSLSDKKWAGKHKGSFLYYDFI